MSAQQEHCQVRFLHNCVEQTEKNDLYKCPVSGACFGVLAADRDNEQVRAFHMIQVCRICIHPQKDA